MIPKLSRNKDGKPLKFLSNVTSILMADFCELIRFDEIEQQIIVIGQLPWKHDPCSVCWTDSDNACLRSYIERKYLFSPSSAMIIEALEAIKPLIAYNPIKERITGVVWDGVPRVDTLFIDFLGADDTPYTRTVTRKAFVAAIARVLSDTPEKFDQMIILIGDQGQGKSTLLAKIGGAYYNGSLSMRDMDNKDGKMAISKAWIVEIQECNGMSHTEENAIKAFLSTAVDKYRPAYGRCVISVKRISVIFGTTNERDGILRDVTGNRRFWPVVCFKEKQTRYSWDLEEDEVLQILAEAKHYYDAGETLVLPPDIEAEARRQQQAAVITDPLEGIIEAWLEPHEGEPICTLQIWQACLGNFKTNYDNKDQHRLKRILNKLGWECGKSNKRFHEYGPQKPWRKKGVADKPEVKNDTPFELPDEFT